MLPLRGVHTMAWVGWQLTREVTSPKGLEGPSGENWHWKQCSAVSKAELPVLERKGTQNKEACNGWGHDHNNKTPSLTGFPFPSSDSRNSSISIWPQDPFVDGSNSLRVVERLVVSLC